MELETQRRHRLAGSNGEERNLFAHRNVKAFVSIKLQALRSLNQLFLSRLVFAEMQ